MHSDFPIDQPETGTPDHQTIVSSDRSDDSTVVANIASGFGCEFADVQIGRRKTRLRIFLYLVGAVAVLFGIVWLVSFCGPELAGILARTFGASVIAMVGLAAVWHVQTIQRVRSLIRASESRGLEQIVIESKQRANIFDSLAPLVVLPRELLEAGRTNTAIRLWTKSGPLAGRPLNVPFEPRLLNETDPGFRELCEGSGVQEGDTNAVSSKATRAPRGGFVGRNIRLRGALYTLPLIALYVIVATIQFIQTGMFRLAPIVWVGFILAMILIPINARPLVVKEWLVVPGGLILRTARRFAKRATVTLYPRHECVLWVLEEAQGNWRVAIAHPLGRRQFLATRSEVDLLLRAWLSPLSPPRVEQLKDFE